MRILIVEPGGYAATFQYVHNLADALAKRGHDTLFATGLRFETRDFARAYRAIEVFDRFIPRPLRLLKFAREIRRHQPEVVHIHGHSHPGSYLAIRSFIKTFASPHFVYTAQDLYPKSPKPYHPWAVNHLYSVMEHVFVNAEQNKQVLIDQYSVPADQITTVPIVDLLAFVADKTLPRSPLLPPDGKIILFFGNLEPRKGILPLLEAFPTVKERIPDARLVIIGSPFGSDIQPYQEKISSFDQAVRDSIVFHPHYLPLTEVSSVLNYSHLNVMPYTHAVHNSGAVATAYGYGKPVVATRLGGIPEVVDEGETGFLVPPGDAAALAGAMIKVLEDEENYRRMVGAVEKKAEEHTWDAVAARTEKAYRKVVDSSQDR